jgi:hypothetical protein
LTQTLKTNDKIYIAKILLWDLKYIFESKLINGVWSIDNEIWMLECLMIKLHHK